MLCLTVHPLWMPGGAIKRGTCHGRMKDLGVGRTEGGHSNYGKLGNKQVTGAGLTWAGFIPWGRWRAPAAVMSSLSFRHSERFKAETLRFTIPCRAGKIPQAFCRKTAEERQCPEEVDLESRPLGCHSQLSPRAPHLAFFSRILPATGAWGWAIACEFYAFSHHMSCLSCGFSLVHVLRKLKRPHVTVPVRSGVVTACIVGPELQVGCLLCWLLWSEDHTRLGFLVFSPPPCFHAQRLKASDTQQAFSETGFLREVPIGPRASLFIHFAQESTPVMFSLQIWKCQVPQNTTPALSSHMCAPWPPRRTQYHG